MVYCCVIPELEQWLTGRIADRYWLRSRITVHASD